METLEDLFRFIDTLPFEEAERNDIKFLLLAQKFDRLPAHFATQRDLEHLEKNICHELLILRKEMEKMKLEITIRFGIVTTVGVTILATLMKVL